MKIKIARLLPVNKILIILSILLVLGAVLRFSYSFYTFVNLASQKQIIGLPAKMTLFSSRTGVGA